MKYGIKTLLFILALVIIFFCVCLSTYHILLSAEKNKLSPVGHLYGSEQWENANEVKPTHTFKRKGRTSCLTSNNIKIK